jgi:hypothetical protein
MTTRFVRLLAGATSLVVIAITLVTTAPASAQIDTDCTAQSGALQPGYDCTGTIPGSPGQNGGSSGNDNGGPRTPPTGKSWWPVQPPLGPCGQNNEGQLFAMYSTWLPDPDAPIVDPASPDTVQCIEPHQGLGSAPGPTLPPVADLQRNARLLVDPATVITNYQERFLTGAPTTFTAQTPDHLSKDMAVPGFHVWLEASPTAFDWNFDDPDSGDDNTASGRNVEHQFEGKPASHAVTVQQTTTWTGVLHVDGLSDIPLEPIVVQQALTKPIDSIKSVLTEPRNA